MRPAWRCCPRTGRRVCGSGTARRVRYSRPTARSRTTPHRQSGDRAADDQALDLRRALEDGEDLAVPVPALLRVLAGVAVAAQDLDGLLRDLHRRLARVQLGHRAFRVVEVLAVAGHPRGAPDQEPGRVDRGLHVGQFEGDRLEVADLAAELVAVAGVVPCVLVGGAGDADRHRAHDRAGRLERAHRRLAGRALALADAGEALVQLLLAAA